MCGLVINEVDTREGGVDVLSICPRVGLTTTGLTGESGGCHSVRPSVGEEVVCMSLRIDEVVVGIGSSAVGNIVGYSDSNVADIDCASEVRRNVYTAAVGDDLVPLIVGM